MTDTVDTGKTRRAELELLRTLPELLTHHMDKRPEMPLYKYFDNASKQWRTLTVREIVERVDRWRHAFASMGLSRGDRVAMLLPNCVDAICFDQAALACSLVPVPLHAIDTPGSSAYIINDSGAKVLVTNRLLKWKGIREADWLTSLKLVVITDEPVETTIDNGIEVDVEVPGTLRLDVVKNSSLPEGPEPTDCAAVVYTSEQLAVRRE